MTKLEKAMKHLGVETLNEMTAMTPEQLKQRIVAADEAMRAVAQEIDDNAEYQALKEKLSDLGAGKRDVDKRQRAVILVALSLINESAAE